jgi:hypothetical protein
VARILAVKTDLLASLLQLASSAPPIRQACLRGTLLMHGAGAGAGGLGGDPDHVLSRLAVLLLHQLTGVLADPGAARQDGFASPALASCICLVLQRGLTGSAGEKAVAQVGGAGLLAGWHSGCCCFGGPAAQALLRGRRASAPGRRQRG